MTTTPDLTTWFWEQGGLAALVFARALGLAWAAPAWGTPALGTRFRLALAALLTLLLLPTVGPSLPAPTGLVALGRGLVIEVAIGSALGLAAALVVAGARQAGELVGGQAGLSAASLFDPEAGAELTPLGQFYGLIALATFLALDGPVTLVAALAESYQALPVGDLALTPEVVTSAFGRVGDALALALRAAAPAALALASAGLMLGLLGRSAPSLQLLSLAWPVRAALGLLLVLLALTALVATFAEAWAR